VGKVLKEGHKFTVSIHLIVHETVGFTCWPTPLQQFQSGGSWMQQT
jgi:hypothetical protein